MTAGKISASPEFRAARRTFVLAAGVPGALLMLGGIIVLPDGWQARVGGLLIVCGTTVLAAAFLVPKVAGVVGDDAVAVAVNAIRSAYHDEPEDPAIGAPTEQTLLARLDAAAKKHPHGIDALAKVAVPLSVPLVAGILTILAGIVAAIVS